MMPDSPDYYRRTEETTMGQYFRQVGTGVLYTGSLDVPAGTPQETPVTSTITLVEGRVTSIGVKFAPGCHGLVKVRIKYGADQIYPKNVDEWVAGDDEVVYSTYDYLLDTAPYELTVEACSPNATYPHTLLIRVTVVE